MFRSTVVTWQGRNIINNSHVLQSLNTIDLPTTNSSIQLKFSSYVTYEKPQTVNDDEHAHLRHSIECFIALYTLSELLAHLLKHERPLLFTHYESSHI